jgi:hypothetical protein
MIFSERKGISLYVTSASFVRHGLNALYSDLKLSLTKLVVKTPPKPINASGSDSTCSEKEREPTSPHGKKRQSKISREKRVEVGFVVSGISRVTKSPGEWEV